MVHKERILAIDPATKTGFAMQDGTSGIWDLKAVRDESTGIRLVKLKRNLRVIFEQFKPTLVVFEAARNAGPKMQGALVVQAEMQGVIKEWCHDMGIEYAGFSPKTIKKHATGNGNASKDKMVESATNAFGIEIIDDNHADALWLLDYVSKGFI